MELPINDEDLNLIISKLDSSPLRDQLMLIAKVRKENPHGPWKRILREQHNMVI